MVCYESLLTKIPGLLELWFSLTYWKSILYTEKIGTIEEEAKARLLYVLAVCPGPPFFISAGPEKDFSPSGILL